MDKFIIIVTLLTIFEFGAGFVVGWFGKSIKFEDCPDFNLTMEFEHLVCTDNGTISQRMCLAD